MALQKQEVTSGEIIPSTSDQHLTSAEEQLQGHPSLILTPQEPGWGQGHPTATKAHPWLQTLAGTAGLGKAELDSGLAADIGFWLGWKQGMDETSFQGPPSTLAASQLFTL